MRSILGLGTATLIANYGLGQMSTMISPRQLLQRAVESGIKYVDTAPAYQDAEMLLGDLQPLLRSNGVRICTKVDGRNTALNLKASTQSSVNRLHCGSVDTLLIHS